VLHSFMLRLFNRFFLCVLCALCGEMSFVLPASAVEWTLHGALKNETAYFISGQKRFDKIQNRIDLKPEAVLSDRREFRGRVLAWYDAAMDVNASNSTDLTAGIKQHYRSHIESKEAYLLYGGGKLPRGYQHHIVAVECVGGAPYVMYKQAYQCLLTDHSTNVSSPAHMNHSLCPPWYRL